MHDSTTLEPTYEDFFSFFREVNVPTPMETSHDNPLGELFLSPTSHTSIFRSIHPNEVWVKGLFVMVSHEEYETPISPFDDDTIREPYLLHLQQHPFLHYDDRHLYGCTYGIHLSHLETHAFPFSLPSPFDVGGNSSHTWVKRYMF